jgi:hypothetical protein
MDECVYSDEGRRRIGLVVVDTRMGGICVV